MIKKRTRERRMGEVTKKVLFCDIDNCYTDSREWFKYIPEDNSREGWDEYIKQEHLAKPNKPIIDGLIDAIHNMDFVVYFLTGREDRHGNRAATIRQIEEFSDNQIKITGDNPNAYLVMRKEFDYRPSAQVKEDMINALVAEGVRPLAAVDDEPSNCDVFVKYGIPTAYYDIENDNLTWRTI